MKMEEHLGMKSRKDRLKLSSELRLQQEGKSGSAYRLGGAGVDCPIRNRGPYRSSRKLFFKNGSDTSGLLNHFKCI